jgi:hypothetical protein
MRAMCVGRGVDRLDGRLLETGRVGGVERLWCEVYGANVIVAQIEFSFFFL